MLKPSAIIIVLAAVFYCCSCNTSDNPVAPPVQSSVMMELKQGNQWTYRTTAFDSSGNVRSTGTTESRIVRDTMINNESWFFVRSDSTTFELFTNKSDGLWYMSLNSSGKISQAPVLIAKYPADVNDSWPSLSGYTMKLAAKDMSVSVPSGTYSCYQYSIFDSASQSVLLNLYFSIGKGYVRSDELSRTPSGRTYVVYRKDLMNLTLN
jgi:hypothetical protein